jgi:hypothetical protein
MTRKTKRSPQRRALPIAVMEALDQVTPALAQKLKATMPKPRFTVNEVLDMVIPDRGVRHLLSEAAQYASGQCPKHPNFEYGIQINSFYLVRVITTVHLDDSNLTFMPDRVILPKASDNAQVEMLEEYCMNMYQSDRSLAEVNALVKYLCEACPTVSGLRALWPDFPSLFAGYETSLKNSKEEPWLLDWGHKFRNMQPGMPPPVFEDCVATIERARRSIALAQLAEPEPNVDSPGVELLILRSDSVPPEPVSWAASVEKAAGPQFLEFKL